MKRSAKSTNIILFIILIGLFIINNTSANTGDIFMENHIVNSGILSWEIHIQRSADWSTDSLMNIIGSSSLSFNFNEAALINPVVIIDASCFFYNSDYQLSAKIIRDKCIVDISFLTANSNYEIPLGEKVLLMKIELTITDPAQTADLSWDKLNTGVFDNTDANVNLSYFGSSVIPLPVELNSFTASLNGNIVKLEWSTETEQNNYGFEIERSEFKVQGSAFKVLGFVEGAGNSNSPKYYSFVDDKLSGGDEFNYRLKQIDNDGNYSYSDVVTISLNVVSYELLQNYPNPFNSSTVIVYHLKEKGNARLKLYDVLGQQIKVLMDEELGKGIHRYELQTSSLASGVYLYSIEINESGNKNSQSFFDVKKMILLK